MRKVFFNAVSYDEGGWFVCEAHDWPYKHKTDKSIFVDNDRNDPEVKAYLQEVREVRAQLDQEMIEIAVNLKLKILDLDGNPYKEGDKIEFLVLDNDDGKKLSETLIAMGWKKEFIPIGP